MSALALHGGIVLALFVASLAAVFILPLLRGCLRLNGPIIFASACLTLLVLYALINFWIAVGDWMALQAVSRLVLGGSV